ncbi:MAG: UbiD family decarboxylase [Chloroflexi bacterium]|nr:UbiD family decarboxylase [Chloroflexota bacterium]
MDDLRTWLAKVAQLDELREIKSADWDLEMGCLTDVCNKRTTNYALLFDEIKGYVRGYRVLTGSNSDAPRVATTLNLNPDMDSKALLASLRREIKVWNSRAGSFPVEQVTSGPVLENVHAGKDIDLFEFPVPRWHELDGGRYIGTGDAIITRDPDTGEINIGTYRIMVHDHQTTALYISPGKHGRQHYEKYHAHKTPCPVAMSFGHHPLIFGVGFLGMPPGTEYSYLGAILNEPVKVIKDEVTGLPFPADSEIVVTGWVPPGDYRIEGPFGEWTGYYASKDRPAPIVKVERIYHRNNPVILGCPPAKYPGDSSYYRALLASAMLHSELEEMGLPDIQGAWQGISGQLFLVVSIKQRYAGHARQAGFLACQSRAGAYMGRYVVVVDEDIDPTDTQEVLWAICTRSDPQSSIDIIRRAWSTPLDPTIRKPTKAFYNSRAIVDACKPYEWKDEFPKEIAIDSDLSNTVKKKWGDLLALQ